MKYDNKIIDNHSKIHYNINMKYKNLIGKKFNRLLVIELAESKNDNIVWKCLCDCGKITNVITANLTSGRVKSCGCLKEEKLIRRNTTHNQRHTKLYEVWKTMKQRCSNPNNKGYKNYGGRGIKVCDEWKNSFQSFFDWSMKNGYSTNLSIDRIDNNGNYCPENCRWTNRIVQANNSRWNKFITINGETHSLADWCRIYKMPYTLVSNRVSRYGWDIVKALKTPKIRSLR